MIYTINKNTLGLIPENSKTKVYEINNNYIINETPRSVVAKNCIIYGSTLEGRQKGSAKLINCKYKSPFILDNSLKLILIPTHSARNPNCVWIVLNKILNYSKIDKQKVEIEFQDYQKLIINTSYDIFDKQVLRATRLDSYLNGINQQKYL